MLSADAGISLAIEVKDRTAMPATGWFHPGIALFTGLGVVPALAQTTMLTKDTRFCPSWAEAHERTVASLNNGRPPCPVKWKGCIVLKRGASVDVVDRQEESTEIIFRGKHWFADE